MNKENLITLKANVERTIDDAIYYLQRVTELEKEVTRLKETVMELEKQTERMERETEEVKVKARLEAGVIL